jgi:hypothetical protein
VHHRIKTEGREKNRVGGMREGGGNVECKEPGELPPTRNKRQKFTSQYPRKVIIVSSEFNMI